MELTYSETCRTDAECEIRLGIASWDDGSGTELAMKFAWFDRNGHVARGGGVPLSVVPQMLEVAISEGGLRLGPAAPTTA
jgi:hypothetical protein